MGTRIGLVGRRADLAVEVASLAARVGAVVVSLEAVDAGTTASGGTSRDGVDLLLIDAQSSGAARAPFVGSHRVLMAVICRADEVEEAQAAAAGLGCEHVVELPLGAAWLEEQVAAPPDSGLFGVVGAVGGVGATTVAISCAVAAGPGSLLVDADPDSPGLDLALGIAEGKGARWPQIPDSTAPLDAGSLRAALPQVAGVTVVTGSGTGDPRTSLGGPTSGQLAGVLGVGRAAFARTVVDLGRGTGTLRLVGPADTAVLVVPASLAGVVSGRRILERLEVGRVVVMVRPSGWLPTTDVAEQLGIGAVLEIPSLRRAAEMADCGDLLAGRTGRALRELGERVWAWHR